MAIDIDNPPRLSVILSRIPSCANLPVGERKSADYLYRNALVIELKEITIAQADILDKFHQDMLREAGLVSTVRQMSMSQIAPHTRRAGYWRKKVEQALFRPLETHLRKAKKQVLESRTRTGAPYGAIFVEVSLDGPTSADDFAILTSNMIGRYVDRNDPEIAAVSEVCLFFVRRNRQSITGGYDQVRCISTQDGMNRPGYVPYLNTLLSELSTYSRD